MKKIDSSLLIDELVNDTKIIIDTVESKFIPLSSNELNFKQGGWSINECIEHLNRADDHYIELFEARLLSNNEIGNNEIFNPGILGNYFTKSMKPKEDGTIPSKMKTFSKFEPKEEKLSLSIDTFLKDQYKMLDILEQSRLVNLNKIRIPSAIGKIINFKMGDALRFVVAHNQRHIKQAVNVLVALKLSSSLS